MHTIRLRYSLTLPAASPFDVKRNVTILRACEGHHRCEIDGAGLRNAVAGQFASVHITCRDEFSNQLSASSIQGSGKWKMAAKAVGGVGFIRNLLSDLRDDDGGAGGEGGGGGGGGGDGGEGGGGDGGGGE